MSGGAEEGSRPLRILLTADAVGGVWTHALDLARALAAGGDRVDLAVLGPAPDAAKRAEARAVPNLALHVGPYRLEWMDDPWEDVDRAGAWLLDLERRTASDVVHLNGYAHAALPWRAPVLVGAHSCVASWWRAVKGEPAPRRYDVYRRRVRRGLAAADLVVAPTRAMLDALEREHGPLPRTRVVPNGRETSGFAPAPKEPRIACVGRVWDEGKNVAALARAAAGLPWPVEVVGDARGPDGRAARFDGCRLLGPLPPEEVARRLARAAIYAHPARYEPFGLSVLEAAASGCALVLADLPSLRETWEDAARYVDPDDPASIRDGVADLIEDAPRRAALGERALRRARRLTPARMARAYRESYASLTGRKVVA